MSTSTIAQLLSTGTNLLFVVIIAIGYYMMIRLYRQMVSGYDRMFQVTEAGRTAMGRPQMIVDDDYSRLPGVDISIRNMSEGAAKDITSKFSSPVKGSDGTVISELSYFKDAYQGVSAAAPSELPRARLLGH